MEITGHPTRATRRCTSPGEAQKQPLLPGQRAGLSPEGPVGRGSGTGALLPHLVLAGAPPNLI